ncbi:MAG: 23S rRNA (pseudouridine(1915)-N(3))-methyltransferase RlmH [Bacteroidetes bacterium]|nr:MAG: 23S rRNA (pseudouridine(1915)-N(3))-methyltransferase RlmH [Bacteroidota bacterium]
MKICLVTIGKNHEATIKAAVDDFTKRISKYFQVEWQIITAPKASAAVNPASTKKKEAGLILNIIEKGDCLVVLDERGKEFSSPELANFIQARANESARRIVFVIGGAYGVDDEVIKKANWIWSLSRLTFPHQVVRLILVEQVYRACTILRNEKYHHE